jgi:hypothetical protein
MGVFIYSFYHIILFSIEPVKMYIRFFYVHYVSLKYLLFLHIILFSIKPVKMNIYKISNTYNVSLTYFYNFWHIILYSIEMKINISFQHSLH